MWWRKSNQVFAKQKKNRSARERLRTKYKSSSYSVFIFIRPLVVLLCVVLAYVVYSNRDYWLERLDNDTSITSYALTHKLQFTTHTDIRDVLSTGKPLKGYFGQNIEQVKERLLTIPWVHSVVVRKLWPDKLSLTILEHRPVALWNDTKLLSDRGVVFTLPFDRVNRTGFPVLYGPDTEGKKVLSAWWKIKQDLRVRNLILKSVYIDGRGSWKIKLSNELELLLGRGDWASKIDRFVKIFPQINVPEGKVISYIDLRYKYGAAVGFISKK
ncbi:cell division protein FtsQ/DivIB [Pasteurella atlantica]|uniref:Cell division protein FtsQ/DivIB n=2 Tax=Pasteurellaceae TaxID=712 RepID=A0ACC6HNV2_9PAST|nr:cell division protein FtsQ/DivIB [Pasteurella atlantica]MDP8034075.1 cell division protein FtsQ/DivIB [Pasteurella atlantica]MDP8036019.1 cell division protein FtsQ/DivIB [Pasteurella atlantica]MDP8037969.1 cell division protein FtsQ/DivIB [Pasteurella atlantica]MDP8048313.1 cell division protein FtsQ/DivIB [Pasteurella atlantica]MDP8050281.1 cell division protein FtsQ/DivIB [Pasteurella atlantica]